MLSEIPQDEAIWNTTVTSDQHVSRLVMCKGPIQNFKSLVTAENPQRAVCFC